MRKKINVVALIFIKTTTFIIEPVLQGCFYGMELFGNCYSIFMNLLSLFIQVFLQLHYVYLDIIDNRFGE